MRGVLKVRPHTKSGGGGGQSTSGPIYEKWGGGSPLQVRYEKWGGGGGGGQFTQVQNEKWGGGAVHFRSDIRKVGAGGGGGGGQFASGPIRKVGGGGGGAIRSGPKRKVGGGGGDTFVWHKENTLSLIINGYNFDQRGPVLKHFTRARK